MEGIVGKIIVRREGGITFLDVKEIISIEASDYYLKIITHNDEHIKRKSLTSIEEKLPTDQFIRIHRSTIVNVDYIKSIERYITNEHIILMKNNKKYRISKRGRKKLKDKFFL